MYFLGSCRYCILLIFTLFINIFSIDSLGEALPGYGNCFNIRNNTKYSITKISGEAAEQLIKIGTNSKANIPGAPKDLYSAVNGSYPTIRWLTHPDITPGLKHLRHILLQIKQWYTEGDRLYITTEYTLINVTGNDFMAPYSVYSYNCTKIRPGSYRLEAVVWFLGNITSAADGRLDARVNEKSRSNALILGTVDIDPVLQKEKQEADRCICLSNVTIQIRQVDGKVSTKITGLNMSNATKVEIQLVKENASGKYLERRVNVSGADLQPYIKQFNVTRGRKYYIRVIRHCQTGYFVSCGKDEADVMRSDSVTIKSDEPGVDEMKYKYTHFDDGHREVSRSRIQIETDIWKSVAQIAFITFAFGACILAEVATIMRILTALFCKIKKPKRLYKQSSCVTLDNKGKTVTQLVQRRRIAIVFKKDSREHEAAVYKIDNELKTRGFETVPFDETDSPAMRTNWIQAAESLVTEFEVIMIAISPLLYEVCKKERTPHQESNNSNTENVNKFPAVVLSALKNTNVGATSEKRKVISVCIAETKQDCRKLSVNMRREHPLIFKDKMHFHTFQHETETRGKDNFQKLISEIISSM